ncbi:unnamed protein product [Coccothraustes coccothraustes]
MKVGAAAGQSRFQLALQMKVRPHQPGRAAQDKGSAEGCRPAPALSEAARGCSSLQSTHGKPISPLLQHRFCPDTRRIVNLRRGPLDVILDGPTFLLQRSYLEHITWD